ncbi:hypothetical protein FB451DRAFT_402273 [Mycena latifolia]|nr:hypothetical protein FB451DRAFT_402273 [Mycena latifolia]
MRRRDLRALNPKFAFEDSMCDPFAVDVWCLGNMIRRTLTEGSPNRSKVRGLRFLDGLIADMTNEDPAKRSRMADVVAEIKARSGQRKLRSRCAREDENALVGIFRATRPASCLKGYLRFRRFSFSSFIWKWRVRCHRTRSRTARIQRLI